MDESVSTFVGGSNASSFSSASKRKSLKEQYAPNRETIKRDAQWMLYQHGLDQRTRLVMRNELIKRKYFDSTIATNFELLLYQKYRYDARLYRKYCVNILSMIDNHGEKWLDRVFEIKPHLKPLPKLCPSAIKEILDISDKEWIKNTPGYQAFVDLDERTKNLQKLIDNRGGLKSKDPGSIIICKKCMKGDVEFWEVQNRSADEGATAKAFCKNCRKFFTPS